MYTELIVNGIRMWSCEQHLNDRNIFLSCLVTVLLYAHDYPLPIEIFRCLPLL